MKDAPLPDRAYPSLLATAVFLAVGLMSLRGTSLAQSSPDPDHLKCYEVRRDFSSSHREIVDLFNKEFGPETGCQLITDASFFCTPTAKFSEHDPDGNDPRGRELQTDFLCYQVGCERNPLRSIVVDDQFGQRLIEILDAKMLCTPTTRIPLTACEETAPACGGVCPPGETCEPSPFRGGCFCE